MASPTPAIQIRALETLDEFKSVEELQLEVWSCNEREVLSTLALIPLLEIGGILLGAFTDGTLIGFVLGFSGFAHGERILHSDMLAMKAAFRGTGLGYKLKLTQREAALANGIERITWTFDPLQATNAHFNFTKLGVIADRYQSNYYGRTSSALHSTGTDRLWVTWLLNSERVINRLTNVSPNTSWTPNPTPPLVALSKNGEPISTNLDNTQSILSIEIPHDINAIAHNDLSLALRWREATRAAFQEALAANYFVSDFVRGAGEQAGVYRLVRSAE